MSVIGISAIGISAMGGGMSYGLPYQPPAASTRSTTQLASGTTITTIRGAGGAVLAVTTASTGAQPDISTFYVTA